MIRFLILAILCAAVCPTVAHAQYRGVITRPTPVAPVPPPPRRRTETITIVRWLPPIVENAPADKPKPRAEGTATATDPDQPIVTFDTRPPEELIREARQVLTNREGPYTVAINNLRSYILTQPPASAMEAHELLGYAYEKSKLYDKAKVEYALYLKLYIANSDDRTRVQQRLMALEIVEPTETANNFRERTPRQGDSTELSGSASEYLYFGATSNSAGVIQWNTSQISSLTGLQLDAKRRHNQYIWSARLRFTAARDLLDHVDNTTRLNSAYVNFEDTFVRYGIRAGRQNPQAGAISRYDGVSAWYRTENQYKWTVAAGVPYTGPNSTAQRHFIGAAFEWRPYNNTVASLYVNRSIADGFTERMAAGTSVEYSSEHATALLTAEYDFQYGTLNQINFQGIRYFDGYNIFTSYERRRSPILYADVALGLGTLDPEQQVYNSINELLTRSGLNSSDIYKYIITTTPIASSFVLGAGYVINPTWTLTGDVQVTNLSTTPGFTIAPQFDPVPVTVGANNNYSLTLHLTGNRIYDTNNTVEVVGNRTVGDRPSYFITVADNYRFWGDNSVSTTLRYDHIQGMSQTLSANLRVIYTIGPRGKLEVQYARSLMLRPNSLIVYKIAPVLTNQTFYIGYRYDF